jgi:phthalate 4,5-cis-dihydrodiol dehydrogenase
VVSCERGDIRQSPQGLYVYGENGMHEIVLPTDRSPRDCVMEEFHQAIRGLSPATHDGCWGLANLEICVAAITSSNLGRDVLLQEQVATPVLEREALC